jgi:hypothetical protein
MNSRLKCNTSTSISEGLVGGQEAEAFSGGVVIALDAGLEFLWGQGGEVGFTGQVAAHAADGVFNAAFGLSRQLHRMETMKHDVSE